MKSPSSWPLISMLFWLLGVVAGGPEEKPQEKPAEAMTVETISAALVWEAAKAGSTDTEIANRFMTTEKQVQELFGVELVVGRAVRAFNLRKAQTITAFKGNGPLLTWLGRNELGQSLNPAAPDDDPEPVLPEKVG